jgi:hypothetical protein
VCPVAIAPVNGSNGACDTLDGCKAHKVWMELCGKDSDCSSGKHCEQATLFGKLVGLCFP